MAKIAFIGLGNMGLPMAINLVKAGHEVSGFDLVSAAIEAAGKAGIKVMPSAAASLTGAEIAITMLPNGKLVLGVYNDILQAAAPGTLFVDSSTIDVDSARKAHELARAAGSAAVDAPVSGGVGGAAAGTLTFMAGGEDAAFARARPVLEAMGRKIVHCGGAGAGQAAKICNNMILGISMIGVCEAFVLGEKLGLSAQALYDVASTSSGQCWSLISYCPVPGPVPASPSNNAYKPGFAAALMLKDLLLSQDAAASAGAATALGKHAAEIYREYVDAGHAGMDFSGIINAIREK
ncbi:3-hydroxyisobutyrate dehydrogenase [Acidocella sp.]|uniref:3-hydroxyisobutyrate dehydrogenase n=1 Tax=Acidocella sp. TaxID=50710 RepID=UPI0026123E33|nr:3-hydroxyisobutyrate dehydrogenase [Acidocella sp.]MDD2796215.1 3-hydroxyisobutyrate dehydrogenase [Acidocella sp.]